MGGGNAKPKSKKSKHSNLKATDSTNSKQSTSKSTSQSDKSPSDYLTLAPSSNPKTGGFIGGEFSASMTIPKSESEVYPSAHIYVDTTYSPKFDIPINIIGGYQWYFYNKPHFNLGLRFKAHLGYSYSYQKITVIDQRTHYSDFTGDFMGSQYSETNAKYINHTMYYGAEAQFLWDFLDRGSHTLGVHFSPLGFEGQVIFYKTEGTFIIEGILPNGSHVKYSGNMDFQDLNNYTSTHYVNYVINLGIHYYYNIHHQVFVTYKHNFEIKGENTNNSRHFGKVFFGYSYKF